MYFHSVGAFLAMGGYGFFVWSAYGIGAVLIVFSMVRAARLPGRERRDIAGRLRRDAVAGDTHDAVVRDTHDAVARDTHIGGRRP